MAPNRPVLIVVHPGSACGSADFNLGRDLADRQRLNMQEAVEQWTGPVAVIDGLFGDELDPDAWRRPWREWGEAIEGALARAKDAGHLSERVMGADDGSTPLNQMEAARKLAEDHGLSPQDTPIVLMGAWVDAQGGGCVHAVREELEEMGFSVTVAEAMDLDAEEPEEDLDDEDEPEPQPEPEPPPAPPHRPGLAR